MSVFLSPLWLTAPSFHRGAGQAALSANVSQVFLEQCSQRGSRATGLWPQTSSLSCLQDLESEGLQCGGCVPQKSAIRYWSHPIVHYPAALWVRYDQHSRLSVLRSLTCVYLLGCTTQSVHCTCISNGQLGTHAVETDYSTGRIFRGVFNFTFFVGDWWPENYNPWKVELLLAQIF